MNLLPVNATSGSNFNASSGVSSFFSSLYETAFQEINFFLSICEFESNLPLKMEAACTDLTQLMKNEGLQITPNEMLRVCYLSAKKNIEFNKYTKIIVEQPQCLKYCNEINAGMTAININFVISDIAFKALTGGLALYTCFALDKKNYKQAALLGIATAVSACTAIAFSK